MDLKDLPPYLPPEPTYAKALSDAGKARLDMASSIAVDISVLNPPFPDLPVSPATQVKLDTVVLMMAMLGRFPGDYPVSSFDRAINYRALGVASVDWLEKWGIRARGLFAPLATDPPNRYIWLFGREGLLFAEARSAEVFFGRLIHCLMVESQIIIAKQYFIGLGLYESGPQALPVTRFLPKEMKRDARFASLNVVDLTQLHGMVFLEYCALMVRAEWDKWCRLICFAFRARDDWGSIEDGFAQLQKKVESADRVEDWCRFHLDIFLKIGRTRLAKDGWLRKHRDSLVHDIGEHPIGALPHAKSEQTTSEMWEKVMDEHNWQREAIMSGMAALLSAPRAGS